MAKCINLHYKAKIGDHHVIGRIGFDEDGYVVLLHNGVKPWRGNSVEEIMTIHGMEDFEIVPRDPETYRDWQVGDVIYNLDDEGNTVSGEDEMCRVIFRSGELVAIAENYSAEEADINGCYTCSQLFREGWRLVLTDIEQQIIEEKRKQEYEPQAGDIVAWKEKKVVEDIPKPYEFKKGDPVLVRRDVDENWRVRVYVCANADNTYRHKVTSGNISENYQMCIPYNERTMHLLGTAEDYKEEQL